MSVSSDWCTKKQTAKLISRTERTVSRIIREAVETQAADILSNLKLIYADGREVPGTEVTADLLAKNEEEGTRTRWFFRRLWWQDEFAARLTENSYAGIDTTDAEQAASEPKAKREVDDRPGAAPPLPSDPAVRSIVLEHLHYNDRKHATEIKQLTDRVLQVVETNQQLQAQTNTLYNQFQEALTQGGGLKALVVGTTASPAPAGRHDEAPSSTPEVVIVESQPTEVRRSASRNSKRSRSKAKATATKPEEPNDWLPTFRRFARYLTRK